MHRGGHSNQTFVSYKLKGSQFLFKRNVISEINNYYGKATKLKNIHYNKGDNRTIYFNINGRVLNNNSEGGIPIQSSTLPELLLAQSCQLQ